LPLHPALLLPRERRRDFAWPRGLLCSGPTCTTLIPWGAPLACVGDIVSKYCLEEIGRGTLSPPLAVLVYDAKTRRSERLSGITPPPAFERYRISNPPGTITAEAMSLLCRLARSRGFHAVRVDGEEDMLALPLIECMPEGSMVTYGVPERGMALIYVSRARKLDAWLRHTYLAPGLVGVEAPSGSI